MSREGLTKRLSDLIFLRAVVITVLLASFYFLKIGYKVLHPTAFSYFIVSLYLLTIIYIIALRFIRNDSRFIVFVYIQIVIDVVAETFLLYLTGGIASWFSFMFPVSIISAGIMLNRRACYVIATLSSALYWLIINLQFSTIILTATNIIFTEKDYFYNIFAHITAFYLVAFLSGYHTEKLRRVTQSLKEKDTVLKDMEVFSKDIIESMPSGVFTTDLNRKIITFNTSAQKIMRCKHDDVMGKDPVDIFPFLGNLKEELPLERTEGEIQYDGSTIPIGMGFSTLKDSSGNPIGIIGVFQDLTELKAMEAEVRKKEKWAYIGELSALIAHELRNPLASLKASIEMLREKKVSEQHAEHLMEIALSEMERLNGIITDFLLYAKPQEPDKKPCDLHQSLRDIITLLRSSETNKKNVSISEDLGGELFIRGDSKQLQQVFWNLGINAIAAISEGGNVSISTKKKDNNTVEVIFKDTGIGISKEDKDKIFYPFFTTKENGTGLGLSVAQKIIEAHGGKITVNSKGSGSGTTFAVALPIN